MTVRIPLVVGSNGLVQQLQAGDTLSVSGGGSSVPTSTQSNLVINDNTQLLFRRKIVMSSNQRTTVGANAVLVGV